MSKRDKYLTEAMGKCWHDWEFEWIYSTRQSQCIQCDTIEYENNNDFSTWDGFGKLYEWSVEQDWWYEFLFEWTDEIMPTTIPYKLVYPNPFANSVYEFLRDRETSSESSNISG